MAWLVIKLWGGCPPIVNVVMLEVVVVTFVGRIEPSVGSSAADVASAVQGIVEESIASLWKKAQALGHAPQHT
jgi:hypothetical protein